jgi:MHS family proline/betaine transporter-like MFS transporter
MVTYLTANLGYSRHAAYLANGAGLIMFCLVGPFAAALSDRIGRRPVMLGSLALFAVLVVPTFLMLGQGGAVGTAGMVLFAASFTGVAFLNPVLAAELYPANVRYTSNALGYNVGYALFGGTAPYVSALLVEETGNKLSPAYYVLGVTVLALMLVFLTMRETFRADTVTGLDTRNLPGKGGHRPLGDPEALSGEKPTAHSNVRR